MLAVTQRTTSLSSPKQATTFGFAIWVGTIGGAALSPDPDPNTTPPAGGRILINGAKHGGCLTVGQGSLRIYGAPVAGGTFSSIIWTYEDTIARWVPFVQTVTVVANGVAQNFNFGTALATRMNQQTFMQLTAVTNVQAIAYDFC